MTGIYQRLRLFTLTFFLSTVSRTGQILAQQNVTLEWISDFWLELSSTSSPGQHSPNNCKYSVSTTFGDDKCETLFCPQQESVAQLPWRSYVVMEGGSLNVSVIIMCNDRQDERRHFSYSYPDLVENIQCYVHSSSESRCHWTPVSNAQDVKFFYELLDSNQGDHGNAASYAQECPLYRFTGNIRTGCDLKTNVTNEIHISIRRRQNSKVVWNTFRKHLKLNVRPPPLKWKVTKVGEKFIIDWVPPEIYEESKWKFKIKYTECNTSKEKYIERGSGLDVNPQCPYLIAIRAELEYGHGQTDWTDYIYFDAETDSNTFVYAAVFIPLMVVGLAVLIFACYKKNKDSMFPKIPEPRNLISDISDNNNMSTLDSFYHLSSEEDVCKVTLVKDPQTP